MSKDRSGGSCLRISLSIFLFGKRRGLERLFETSKAFTTLYAACEDGRGAESTSVYRCYKLWALRFWNKGVRLQSLYQNLAKTNPYSFCLQDGHDRATAGIDVTHECSEKE